MSLFVMYLVGAILTGGIVLFSLRGEIEERDATFFVGPVVVLMIVWPISLLLGVVRWLLIRFSVPKRPAP